MRVLPYVLLLLLPLLAAAEVATVAMCDATSDSWSVAFTQKMYLMQPPPTNQPYTPGACKNYFAGTSMTQFWTPDTFASCEAVCASSLALQVTACVTTGVWSFATTVAPCIAAATLAAPFWPLCYQPWVVQDANACKQVLKLDYDRLHGYNFVFKPWPATAGAWSSIVTYEVCSSLHKSYTTRRVSH